MRVRAEWTTTGIARSTSFSLRLLPEGPNGPQIAVDFRDGMPGTDRVAVADRILTEVTAWRDAVARNAAAEHTTAAELAEAHATIARLKAQGGAS